MKKQIVLNCTPQEVRVAILEGAQLAELHIERSKDRGVVGNVYKAKVQRVLPGMQAAFVDIGFEKSAFLHASDFRHGLEELPHSLTDDDSVDTEIGGEPVDADGSSVETELEDASAENGAEEAVGSSSTSPPPPNRRERGPRLPLEDKLSRGEEIIVQVSKEPMGTKGPRVTSYVSLAGRYLVYIPTTSHIGVSRRIADEQERRRLKELVTSCRPPEGGFIVRTVCEGLSRKEIQADVGFLTRLWSRVLKKSETASAPAILYSDMDLVQRTVRDFFSPEVGRVLLDSPTEHQRLLDLVESLAPRLKGRVSLYEDAEPIFDRFGIESQIDRALERKVWLRSGGTLVIERTESLTAIDVNTGRFVGRKNQEETILKTNLEAAEEVVRQLRLRNIGGLIIIDFIDMENEANRRQVSDALVEHVRQMDKAQTKILKISELGLVEMTRKRTRESLEQTLCAPCSHCGGTGLVKSPETVAFEILRRLVREARVHADAARLVVKANPGVASFLSATQAHDLDQMEQQLGKKIVLKAQESFEPVRYEIVAQ
ncbi:MAG: ribonuclease [Candidatus Binatota bacterium]|nr:ribonuclease [Candidatus Binatota bacterium]